MEKKNKMKSVVCQVQEAQSKKKEKIDGYRKTLKNVENVVNVSGE